MTNEATKITARKMLADGLQELPAQLERTDAQDIANELGVTASLVRMYLKGTVHSVDTGSDILKVARSIILKREKSIQKLVA